MCLKGMGVGQAVIHAARAQLYELLPISSRQEHE